MDGSVVAEAVAGKRKMKKTPHEATKARREEKRVGWSEPPSLFDFFDFAVDLRFCVSRFAMSRVRVVRVVRGVSG